MALVSIITHRITRSAPGGAVTTQARTDAFNISGKLEEFIYELKSQFIRKSGKSYGRFSSETADFPVSAWLQEYRAERLGFASFTQKAMQHYKAEIEKIESLVDAYVFFVEEKIEARFAGSEE